MQDYAFVETLASLIGHAIGDAPTIKSKRRLTEFLGTITNEENDFFERSFDALEVPEADRTDRRWILICRHGYSSSLAAWNLRQMGLTSTADVIGKQLLTIKPKFTICRQRVNSNS